MSGSCSDPELSSVSTSSSTPPSPMKPRQRPVPLRLQSIGVDPSILAGKVLTKIQRSTRHPSMQLHFSDNTSYQILVDGYDPMHPGLPKQLETDPSLASHLDAADGQLNISYTIEDCVLITLSDKAFDSRQREQRWNQSHTGLAFKFREDRSWHCVWATLTDYDHARCVFRSYDDVYLERLQRSPRKRRNRAPSSPTKSR